MKAEQFTERAPGVLVWQDPRLIWAEPEVVRQPRAKLSGRQQDDGR